MNIPDSDWGDYEVDEKSKNLTLTKKGFLSILNVSTYISNISMKLYMQTGALWNYYQRK